MSYYTNHRVHTPGCKGDTAADRAEAAGERFPVYGRMTTTARSIAMLIPAEEIVGTLEHWSTSIGDDRVGRFTFGDDKRSYVVTNDGRVTSERHERMSEAEYLAEQEHNERLATDPVYRAEADAPEGKEFEAGQAMEHKLAQYANTDAGRLAASIEAGLELALEELRDEKYFRLTHRLSDLQGRSQRLHDTVQS